MIAIENNHVEDVFVRNNLVPDNHYQYELASQRHKEGIIQVFTDTFCEAEPMTQYLHMDPKKYKAFAKEVTENAIRDQLSIVALDNDKVIACALIEDFAAMHDVPMTFDKNFKYIISLLETLGGNFFKDKKFEINTIAHLFITAVSKEYRHSGISTQVNFRAMNLAARKGFKFVYCELTNVYNERGIFNHMLENHKRLLGACDYIDFEIDGFKPFPRLKGYAHGYLWEIHKGAKLIYTVNDKMMSEPF